MSRFTFFNKKLPIQTSRQHMAEIDLYMVKRSRLGVLSWFIVTIILAALLFDAGKLSNFHIVMTGLILVSTVMRGFMIWQFDFVYGKGADAWRSTFLWVSVFSALCWGMFSSSIIINWVGDGDLIILITFVFTAVIVLGASSLYKPYDKFLHFYLWANLAPQLIALALQNEKDYWILFSGVAALAFYVRNDIAQQYDSFWTSRDNQYRLQKELGKLNAVTVSSELRNDLSDRFVKNVMEMVRPQLVVLRGLIPLLRRTNLTPEQAHITKLISHTISSVQNATVDLEAYTAIRAGKLNLAHKPFNLSRFIEDVMEVAGAQAHSRGNEMSYLHNLDVAERIVGDKAHLQTVFNGLLGYATQISDDGELSLKVSQFFREHQVLRFQLRIPYTESYLPHKLENALQMKMMEDVELGGFDLALTVAIRLLHMMDGKVEVRLKNQQYIEVLILLPLEVSTLQNKSFKPDKCLLGKKVALLNMPEKGEKALTAEFTSWGMDVVEVDMEHGQKDIDVLLMNIPVNADMMEIEDRITKVLNFCKLTNTQLALYNSLQYAHTIADVFPHIMQIPKPIARKRLHDGLIDVLKSDFNALHDNNNESGQ